MVGVGFLTAQKTHINLHGKKLNYLSQIQPRRETRRESQKLVVIIQIIQSINRSPSVFS